VQVQENELQLVLSNNVGTWLA